MIWLAIKNLRAKPARSVLTLLGIALATGALFSLLSFQKGYKEGLRRELEQLGAHVLVVPKGCPYDAASIALHGANWPCYLKESYLSQAAQTPGVGAAAPVFMCAEYGSGNSRNVFVGVDSNYLALKTSWKIDGRFPSAPGDVLIGSQKAKDYKARVGDLLPVGPGLNFKVAGILSPLNGPDDDFLFLRLRDAQQAFKREGSLTHILVKLADPEDLEKAVENLRGCDAGMQMNIVPLSHLFQTIKGVIQSTRYLLAAIASIAFFIAAAALVNTMFMNVLERTGEIGVLRAIGASRGDIFNIFLREAGLLSILGYVCGILGAFLFSRVIESWIRSQLPYSPGTTLISLDAGIAGSCLLFVLFIGGVAAIAPAVKAARLPPVEAFRRQAQY